MNQPNNLKSAQCKERIDTGVCPVPFTHCTSVKQPCLVPCNAPLLKIWVKACFLKFSAIRTLRIKIPSKHLYIPRPLNHQARISAVLGLQQDLGATGKVSGGSEPEKSGVSLSDCNYLRQIQIQIYNCGDLRCHPFFCSSAGITTCFAQCKALLLSPSKISCTKLQRISLLNHSLHFSELLNCIIEPLHHRTFNNSSPSYLDHTRRLLSTDAFPSTCAVWCS